MPIRRKGNKGQSWRDTGRYAECSKADGGLLIRLEKFCIAEFTSTFSEKGFLDFREILFAFPSIV